MMRPRAPPEKRIGSARGVTGNSRPIALVDVTIPCVTARAVIGSMWPEYTVTGVGVPELEPRSLGSRTKLSQPKNASHH